jgi:hypothetical protein
MILWELIFDNPYIYWMPYPKICLATQKKKKKKMAYPQVTVVFES